MDENNQVVDPVYNLAVSPVFSKDQTIFAARASGLYRSMDGGQSWNNAFDSLQSQEPIPASWVVVSPDFAEDRQIFAAAPGGVLRSEDGGQTWTVAMLPTPTPFITALAVSPDYASDHLILASTMQDGIFRSVDGGARWVAWNFGLFDLHVYCAALSPDFGRDQTVYLGTESGMFRSLNGGLGWREVDFPIEHAPVLSLALSPNFPQDRILFAGTELAGLFRSGDAGKTWEQVVPWERIGSVNAVLAVKSGRVLALGDETILVSRDTGKSWQSWRNNLEFDDQLTCLAIPQGVESGAPVWVGLANGKILQM
jgi:photosystem II stability/assembly factor-like uncharacterized protein